MKTARSTVFRQPVAMSNVPRVVGGFPHKGTKTLTAILRFAVSTGSYVPRVVEMPRIRLFGSGRPRGAEQCRAESNRCNIRERPGETLSERVGIGAQRGKCGIGDLARLKL